LIQENANIAQNLLAGKSGSRRDIVLLNAGCAIYAADRAKTIAEGIKLAQVSIDSQAASKKLELLKEYSQ
jgi:anthranilate phosphoribosyltransferase